MFGLLLMCGIPIAVDTHLNWDVWIIINVWIPIAVDTHLNWDVWIIINVWDPYSCRYTS